MFKYMWQTIFGKSKGDSRVDLLFEQMMEYTEAVQRETQDEMDDMEDRFMELLRNSQDGTNSVLMAIARASKLKPKTISKMLTDGKNDNFKDDLTEELLDWVERQGEIQE